MNIKDSMTINHNKLVMRSILRILALPARCIFTYLRHHWFRNYTAIKKFLLIMVYFCLVLKLILIANSLLMILLPLDSYTRLKKNKLEDMTECLEWSFTFLQDVIF